MRCPSPARLSAPAWALRTALVATALTLALHARPGGGSVLGPAGPFFGALTAAFCSQATLGASARCGAHVGGGAALGAAAAAALLAAAGARAPPPPALWTALALATPATLLLRRRGRGGRAALVAEAPPPLPWACQ